MPDSDPYIETILLAVTGMSPAILTETIWALAREAEPVIPHRVIVVTTLTGRDRIAKDLFEPRSAFGGLCAWEALKESLASAGHDMAGKLRFGTTPDDLRVITSADPATARSRELADLRDHLDNDAAADFLLDQVRAICANPDTRLIASIAGGRKTMGALLYACMTLAGREDDRITHVLVSEPFDTLPAFFYPAQPGPGLPDRNDITHSPSSAVVDLADVPFVPIRNLFHAQLGRAAGTFSHLVTGCRSEIRHRAAENLRLEILTQRPALRLNHTEIKLTDREHHLLGCLAKLAKQAGPPLPSYKDALAALAGHANEWNALIDCGKIKGHILSPSAFGDDKDVIRVISELRNKLRKHGQPGAILADALPGRGRFSLDMPGELIHIS